MSSWGDGSQTAPLAKLPFQPPAAPSCEETILLFVLGNDKLWSSKHFMFDIWHFPKRPNPILTTQWTGDKDASFFRDRQHYFWRARQNHKHLLTENGAETIRSLETWVGINYHMTLSILIFWLIAFQIVIVSGNSLIELVLFLWTFLISLYPFV